MLRDVVKLGLVTAVGLGVVATVGVGVGVATLVAGAIFAGISSAESQTNETTGSSTPKVQERKLPKQDKPSSPHVSAQEKRPSSDSTKKQTPYGATDVALEPKSGRSPATKTSVPNGRNERNVPISEVKYAAPIGTEERKVPTSESKYSAPNGIDDRKVPTPTPNRKRSSSVVVNKPGDATTSSREDGPRVGSSNGTALSGDKPSSLSRELEAQIAPEVMQWRNEKSSNQETRKRGTASGRGSNEKRSSPVAAAKTETVPVPEPPATVNAPGPLPLLPPSKPKSTPHLSQVVELQPEPEIAPAPVAEPIKEEKLTPSQNVISQGELSLSKLGDRPAVPLISSKLDRSPLVPAQDSRSEAQRRSSYSPVVSPPVEESSVLVADAILAITASTQLETEPLDVPSTSTTTTTVLNGVVPNGGVVLQGPGFASQDSLVSVQRRNSKLASAAKKVSHSVKRVFKGPDGKVIHPDPQRLASSSSDSVDSQRFTAEHEQALLNGHALSKLASSSRESFASTKSRRSLMDGTRKSLKRMFKGSSDNVAVPPVPPLPGLTSTLPESSINSEKPAVVPSTITPAPKPAKSFSSKNALPSQQQQHQQQPRASVSNPPQSTRNALGASDSGNNASPLLKGMFKGRSTRVRR